MGSPPLCPNLIDDPTSSTDYNIQRAVFGEGCHATAALPQDRAPAALISLTSRRTDPGFNYHSKTRPTPSTH